MRGIGLATTLLFAREGYDVYINYKSDSVSANKFVETIIAGREKCMAV